MITGWFLITLGICWVILGSSIVVRDYCNKFLIAPKENIVATKMVFNGAYTIAPDGSKIENPEYQFLILEKEGV